MPVIKSAIKKLRKDRKRTEANDSFRADLEKAVKAAKRTKTAKAVSVAVSSIDKAVKKNLMHANKASRMKASLAKLAKPAGATKPKTASKSKPASTKKAKSSK